MAYNAKTNWQGNDPVTEGDINRWEQGIKDAHTILSDALIKGTTAVSSGSANTLTDQKYYTVTNAVTATPSAAAYLICNTPKTAAGAFYQFALNLSTNAVHFRLFNGSAWSSWTQQETTAGSAAKVKAVTDTLGKANGIATLNENGLINRNQIGALRWRDVMGIPEGTS